jgi:hypothetical protein
MGRREVLVSDGKGVGVFGGWSPVLGCLASIPFETRLGGRLRQMDVSCQAPWQKVFWI